MKKLNGLSEENRNLITGITFGGLLLLGPIDPYGLGIRIAYLVVIPFVVWLLLGYFGKNWTTGDKAANDRLNRAIAGMLAGAFLIGAVFSLTATKHTECDQEVRTYDGTECVGDYVTVKGADKGGAMLYGLFTVGALWYAVRKSDDGEE